MEIGGDFGVGMKDAVTRHDALVIFVGVFGRFNQQECHAQDQGCGKEATKEPILAELYRTHAEGDGEAAGEQHRRVPGPLLTPRNRKLSTIRLALCQAGK